MLADIPFLSLDRQLAAERKLIEGAFGRVLDRGQLVLGPEVAGFEAAFAEVQDARYCIGVANGLDAITLMLHAAGIEPGDEVIVPGNTNIATWLAVSACGARVLPVEPDPHTFNLDVAHCALAVTSRTKAILAVHLYGQCADMEALAALAGEHNILLLSDAAQAAGAMLHGRPVGAFGCANAFSFYPTKNLAALGDGGAVVTNDAVIADRIRHARNYGATQRDRHIYKGRNSRLDELQAAVLIDRLRELPKLQQRRREIARLYCDALSDCPGVIVPAITPGAEHAWHLFTIRCPGGRRDHVRAHLARQGIGTGIYYPVPPHRQLAYAEESRYFPSLSITDTLSAEILNLPLHPYLTIEEAAQVAETVLSAVRSDAA